MRFYRVAQRRYAQFERLAEEAGLLHAYSTRPDDVSARTDDAASTRAQRRATMAGDLGLDATRLCHCVQVHQTRIGIVRAVDGPTPFDGYDGLITALRGVPLMTFSADCPLVLVFDPAARVVGMVHASWRCTVATATRNLVETMQHEFNCRTGDMHAGVGPSAGPESYEVRDDVYQAAAPLGDRDTLFRHRDGRMTFDLWEANRRQLLDVGVPGERIEIAGIDTMQAADTFYSFRREGAGCGHFGLMAGLRSST
ncbi:MAG: polyphenol oxidase family protein [Phycisphaerae bacterium]